MITFCSVWCIMDSWLYLPIERYIIWNFYFVWHPPPCLLFFGRWSADSLEELLMNSCLGLRNDPHKLLHISTHGSRLKRLEMAWHQRLVKINPLTAIDLDRFVPCSWWLMRLLSGFIFVWIQGLYTCGKKSRVCYWHWFRFTYCHNMLLCLLPISTAMSHNASPIAWCLDIGTGSCYMYAFIAR